MKRVGLLLIFFVANLLSISQCPSVFMSLKSKDYGGFTSYLSSVFYNASSLYRIKQFSLSNALNIFSDIPELIDPIYTPLVRKYASDLICRENSVGDIDVFFRDTVITVCPNPFACGDQIYLRRFWPERPDLSYVCPPFSLFAFDGDNHSVFVDSLCERIFYRQLYKINAHNASCDTLQADVSTFPPHNLHKHIACYSLDSMHFNLLCSCNAFFSREDYLKICSICYDYCISNSCQRISFELYSWHTIPISDFHSWLLMHFPTLNLPFVMIDKDVLSQKSLTYIMDLQGDSLMKYFEQVVASSHVEERFYPIGFVRWHDFFIVLIRRKKTEDIVIEVMDASGNSISSASLATQIYKDGFILREDGHIISLNLDTHYVVSQHGNITKLKF